MSKKKRRRMPDPEYLVGIDVGAVSGDYSAYAVMERDPVSKAIRVVESRVFPAIGEDARRIIREDLERFGFRLAHDAGGPES